MASCKSPRPITLLETCVDCEVHRPKLYFVKVDVQTCFDTIEQTKLLEILKDVISEDEYSIQRHGQVSSASGKIRRSFVKTGIPGGMSAI